MKAADNLSKKQILILLKTKAPSLFVKYARKRISNLQAELSKLRQDWVNLSESEREKVKVYAFSIKEDIKELQELLEDKEEKPKPS